MMGVRLTDSVLPLVSYKKKLAMSDQFNRPWRKGSIFIAACALFMGLFVVITYQRGDGQAAGANSAVGRGHSLVLTGQLLGGGRLNTAKWKGKVVVVDFWGTWCPWCLKQAPYISKLYSKYHRHGLEVVGVPVQSTAESVTRYQKAHPKESWPQIFNHNHGNSALAQKLGITGFPTEFIIDRHGVLRHIIVGYSPRQLAADVKRLLAKQRAAH